MTTEVRRAVADAIVRAFALRADIPPDALRRKLDGEIDFTVADLASIAATLDVSVTSLAPSLRVPR